MEKYLASALGPVRLEGPRLVLREYRADDLEVMAGLWANPAVMRYMFSGLRSRERAAEVVAQAQADALVVPRRRYSLACCLPGDDTAIGSSSVEVRDDSSGYLHAGMMTPYLRGHALGVDLGELAMRLVFEHLGLSRAWCMVKIDNLVMRRLLRASGMTPVGQSREYFAEPDQWFEIEAFELHKAQWQARPPSLTSRALLDRFRQCELPPPQPSVD
jgi:RimJ/RimL family protein N-acetyltransferase